MPETRLYSEASLIEMGSVLNFAVASAPFDRSKTTGPAVRDGDSSLSSRTVNFGPDDAIVVPLLRPRLASHFFRESSRCACHSKERNRQRDEVTHVV